MEILLFLLLGLFVGTFGTLVGIGGGLICVPVFIFFMSCSLNCTTGVRHPWCSIVLRFELNSFVSNYF